MTKLDKYQGQELLIAMQTDSNFLDNLHNMAKYIEANDIFLADEPDECLINFRRRLT